MIARERGHSTVSLHFRPVPLALDPMSRGALDIFDTDGRFTFLKNADGRFSGIRFRFGHVERDMRRTAT
jgi:hypothetical protein